MIRFALMGAVALASTPAAALNFIVRAEAPGVQSNLAVLRRGSGVETFNARTIGAGQEFTTNFGGSLFSGTYKNIEILGANQFGGAGGNTRFANARGKNSFTLTFTSAPTGGVTYFGMWWSALDGGNVIEFFQGGDRRFTFGPSDYRQLLQGSASQIPTGYFGNPNSAFARQNSGEPYAFLNFYAVGGSFDKIRFRQQTNGAGFETDNHTVGQWLTTDPIPEPATWAMLIAGFGLVGAMRRRAGLAAA